jgi:energy-coupling factor transporter ATP-binding protein EcfA2
MDYDYSDLVEKSRRWIDQATATGWIPAENIRPLTHLEEDTPRALFDQGQSRPLIVAFMGGTGVGKSSLLNRLAGTAIARTGIERPTSREVTLYHHQSVEIRHLPENLPIASIKIAQHRDDAKKNIIWIDMPDFDSIEQSNKHLVLQWLPHIDVLIYVVSPERYKDAKAWRLLLAEGGRHAWLFVLNQWDRGRLEQYEDFKRQLGQAGFAEPIIFRTVCGEASEKDEFDALASTIASLASEHIVEQLEQRGLQVRKAELRHKLERYRDVLGSKSLLQRSEAAWQEQWQKTSRLLQEGFAWPLQQLATHYADHAADLVANPVTGKYPAKQSEAVWDDWAQSRFDDALDEFVGFADQLGVPPAPIKQQLAEVRQKAPKIVRTQTELAARKALANPGNALQRALLKCVRVAEIVLPLAAISWVSYKVFTVYYYSDRIDADYLGVDFAIHSSLLIAISWLAPWFILKKVKPSLRTSALKGLNKGLAAGLGMIESEVVIVLERIRHDHDRHHQQVSQLIEQCGAAAIDPSSRIDSKSPLNRMLIGDS